MEFFDNQTDKVASEHDSNEVICSNTHGGQTSYITEHLATCQGQVDPRSVNGCAVIASMVCFMHLAYQHMANKLIHDIIDTHCGPILERIRAATQCEPGEAVIFSDANDFVWSSYGDLLCFPLQQKMVQGNCAEKSALERFVAILASMPGKASAAFCAFGHVIAILKDGVCFEWVDSMPGSQGFATRVKLGGELEQYLLEYIQPKQAGTTPQMFQAFIWARKQDFFSSTGSGKAAHPLDAQKPPPPRNGHYEDIDPGDLNIRCCPANSGLQFVSQEDGNSISSLPSLSLPSLSSNGSLSDKASYSIPMSNEDQELLFEDGDEGFLGADEATNQTSKVLTSKVTVEHESLPSLSLPRKLDLFSSIGSGKAVHPLQTLKEKPKNKQKPPPPRDGRYEYIAPENRHIKCGRGNYKHPGNRALNEACVARYGQTPPTPTERKATAIAVLRQMQEDGRLFIAEYTKTKKWYIVSDEFALKSIKQKVRQHYRPNRQ